MIYILYIVIVLISGVIILYPLFASQNIEKEAIVIPDKMDTLIEKKHMVYTSIKELEFDFKTGKLSEEDYSSLVKKYKAEAVRILKEIDALTASYSRKSEKREQKELRESTKKRHKTQGLVCPKCGSSYRKGDNFCGHCGVSI